MAAQTMPLAGLVTKFSGRLPAGVLQADSSATTLFATLAIKLGDGIPAEVLLVDGDAYDAFDGPGHQVCWRAP